MRRDPLGLRPAPAGHVPLPVLAVGRYPFPRACWRCGSHILDADPPLDGDRFGTIGCVACGRVLAYVAPLPRSTAAYVAHINAEGTDDDRGDRAATS